MKYERLKELREEQGKLQIEIALYLNIKQTTYSKYERGYINVPVEVLIKLAHYYDVSVDYLVGLTDSKMRYERKK